VTTPVRTCVGCRRRDEQTNLVRYVRVDGRPTPDERCLLPGRGAWVHDDAACLAAATKGGFSRALRKR